MRKSWFWFVWSFFFDEIEALMSLFLVLTLTKPIWCSTFLFYPSVDCRSDAEWHMEKKTIVGEHHAFAEEDDKGVFFDLLRSLEGAVR